jgi:hypothetical protein
MGKARASWVARRTLHRRVGAPVGEIEGLPTYSIEGTQLALPLGAHHFRRVVACARCGRQVIDLSRPLYRRRDLHAEIPLLCDECARLAVGPANGDQGRPSQA